MTVLYKSSYVSVSTSLNVSIISSCSSSRLIVDSELIFGEIEIIYSINLSSKVLSIGPRNEGELYLIRSLGFKWKNISSIDLISYSPKIKLGDIHQTDYPDNLFDVIICGWVIPYSNNYKKILDEIYRISNNRSILCIGYTFIPEEKDRVRKYKSSENRFNSNNQIIQHYGDKIKHVYFSFDAYNDNKDLKRQSIFISRFNKKI